MTVDNLGMSQCGNMRDDVDEEASALLQLVPTPLEYDYWRDDDSLKGASLPGER